jgi:hypothetical protein
MLAIKFKKYWKISLICLASFFILCYYLFMRKKDITSVDPSKVVDKLQEGLGEIKDKIQEASNTAVVETVVAKKELIDVKKELNEVAKIKNTKERRSRLADLAVRSEDY